jgi:uroporphyrinogen-III synthase
MKPLQGIRVLITRDAAQADDLKQRLTDLGASVICIPTIRLVDPPDWQPFDTAAAVWGRFDWMIFTSVNAVRKTRERLQQLAIDLEPPPMLKIAAVGEQTAQAVKTAGWSVALMPQQYQGEGLLAALERRDLRGQSVWFPRALAARDLLIEGLERAGATVVLTPVYRNTIPFENRQRLQQVLEDRQADWITFTSSSTATNFVKILGTVPSADRLPKLASIGEITSRTLREHNLQPAFTAIPQNLEGLCRGMLNWHGFTASEKSG